MAKKRIARVNEQLKRELTTLLRFDVRDPRIGLVTVTDVETSPDLYHARVYVSLTGGADERDSALEGLRAAAGFLRGELGRRMHIRRAPELHFVFDETLEHAMHIEKLLREARASSATDERDGVHEPDVADDDEELEIEVELEDDDSADDFDDDEESSRTHD